MLSIFIDDTRETPDRGDGRTTERLRRQCRRNVVHVDSMVPKITLLPHDVLQLGDFTLCSVYLVAEFVLAPSLPDFFIERLKASAWHQLYLPFTHARSESINADSLKLQLLTARKEWWPATADS